VGKWWKCSVGQREARVLYRQVGEGDGASQHNKAGRFYSQTAHAHTQMMFMSQYGAHAQLRWMPNERAAHGIWGGGGGGSRQRPAAAASAAQQNAVYKID